MSKFFPHSSSESSSESSDDEVPEVQVKKLPTTKDFNFPSDSEDAEKRVVRAHKDKKFDELKDKVRNIRNAKNNRDFTKLLSEFDELVKVYDKSKTVFARQNIENPRFYVRCVVEIEDFVNKVWKDNDAKNALSKVNGKALKALLGKIRKYNSSFGPAIQEYRDNADPEGYN